VTFRVRLTLLFVVSLAVLAALSSTIIYAVVRDRLATQDRRAAAALATTAALGDSAEITLDRIASAGDRIWLVDGHGHVEGQSYRATGTTIREIDAIVARGVASGMVTASAATPGGGQAIVLHGTADTQRALSTVRTTLIFVDLVAVALAAVAGALLASWALRPVDRMRAEADRIPGHELARRLPEGRNDELGRLARAFNRLLARAQTASAEQEQFIADASHELKTPVMAIEGHARILARALGRNDIPQATTSATVVERESHRLALILRDLLELAESAATAAPREPVRLDLVAGEACAEIEAVAPDRTIRTDLVPATILGDANRVRELLFVLLDNAVKYSPADEPVDLQLTHAADGGTLVRIRDRGPGVTEAELPGIFGRFARGSAAIEVPGSGLGLAIARALAGRHQATLELLPAEGGGTVATVRFPPAPVPAVPARTNA